MCPESESKPESERKRERAQQINCKQTGNLEDFECSMKGMNEGKIMNIMHRFLIDCVVNVI